MTSDVVYRRNVHSLVLSGDLVLDSVRTVDRGHVHIVVLFSVDVVFAALTASVVVLRLESL